MSPPRKCRSFRVLSPEDSWLLQHRCLFLSVLRNCTKTWTINKISLFSTLRGLCLMLPAMLTTSFNGNGSQDLTFWTLTKYVLLLKQRLDGSKRIFKGRQLSWARVEAYDAIECHFRRELWCVSPPLFCHAIWIFHRGVWDSTLHPCSTACSFIYQLVSSILYNLAVTIRMVCSPLRVLYSCSEALDTTIRAYWMADFLPGMQDPLRLTQALQVHYLPNRNIHFQLWMRDLFGVCLSPCYIILFLIVQWKRLWANGWKRGFGSVHICRGRVGPRCATCWPVWDQISSLRPLMNCRFTGKDAEPRPGLSSGHMPNSFSLPFSAFLKTVQNPHGSTYTIFREPSDIRDELVKAIGEVNTERIVKGEATAVTTCGSGMTAGVLWLGLKTLNAPKIGLYDEVCMSFPPFIELTPSSPR